MFLYAFARPNQMNGHRFTDDVALCIALTHKQAIKKFGGFYDDIQPDEVQRINRIKKIRILTSY